MAKRTRKGGLVGKLGTAGKKGVAAHKGDETSFDTGARLPAGIEGGVAQLKECKFDVFKTGEFKGEYYFLANGVVKQPLEHDGIPTEGLHTQIGPEPMCNTPKRERRPDVESHIDWVLNEMRKLGLDTSELGVDGLEDAAAALKEEQPHFRFRTWKGQKQTEGPYKDQEPRVNEVWSGACEYEEDEEGDDVVDATGEEEAEEEEADTEDLQALGIAADEGDETAEATLSERAEEADVDPNDFATWAEVAAVIQDESEKAPEDEEEEEEESEEGEEEEEDFLPEQEQVYGYKPPNKRKAVECEVSTVFPRKKTCNLKSLDDGKLFKNVPFDKLEGDEE